MIVERRGGRAADMLALGVFVQVPASRICPVPALVGYCSRHSFMGGLLVDKDSVREAVAAMYAHARSGLSGRQALVFPKWRTKGPVASAFEEQARAAGLLTHRLGVQQRAILLPSAAGREALRRALGKRFSEVERCKRRLTEHGKVTWRCVRKEVDDVAVENFLRLEHQGWKAMDHASLRASPADEAFFKDVVTGFANDSRALFTELRVGERIIASTSNFVSGGAGFAFKLGWDADMRKFGPGLLNEAEFVSAAPQVCGDLAWFDSGAGPDSFINRVWTERTELATLVVPLTKLGGLSLRLTDGLRRIAERIRSARSAAAASTGARAAPDEAATSAEGRGKSAL